uniref:ADP-ribosylation factor n=1 Tax=Panagrolaimus davidi TaxID=227884 RepID=A0A914QB84_9BILA
MFGLDAVGKTTILYKLLLPTKVITTIPTIGFNIETFEYKNISFTIWDSGGGDKLRPLFRHYFEKSDTVIFVVDSTDYERMDEAAEFLHGFFNEKIIQDVTLLILANKQDLPNALSVEEIKEKLKLANINTQNWHIQGCSAYSGYGLYDGFAWIAKQINETALK